MILRKGRRTILKKRWISNRSILSGSRYVMKMQARMLLANGPGGEYSSKQAKQSTPDSQSLAQRFLRDYLELQTTQLPIVNQHLEFVNSVYDTEITLFTVRTLLHADHLAERSNPTYFAALTHHIAIMCR